MKTSKKILSHLFTQMVRTNLPTERKHRPFFKFCALNSASDRSCKNELSKLLFKQNQLSIIIYSDR